MILTLKNITDLFEKTIPLSLQETWDKCGLQVGSPSQKISKVLLAYDCCHEVMEHAIKNKIDLIVTHHPLQLKDYKNIHLDTYEGRMIYLAIKHDIAIYTAHTNHDASEHSLSRHYAARLELANVRSLAPVSSKPYVKLVTFVPKTHSLAVSTALFESGAGHIGHYDSCSFRLEGTGSFRGDAHSQPFLGTPGQLEEATEDRIETIVPRTKVDVVLKALFKSHPYEEVAYDLYPLENPPYLGGHGAVGDLPKKMDLGTLIEKVKEVWGLKKFRWVGKPKQKVQRVGIVTGSGMSYLNEALQSGCDVFITGDIKYHQAVEALRKNMALIDPGHFDSEKASVEILKNILDKLFGKQLKTSIYSKLKDPFEFYNA